MGIIVYYYILILVNRGFYLCRTQFGIYPRNEFHNAERLCQIIVRTEIKSFYLIYFGVFGGNHNYGNIAH